MENNFINQLKREMNYKLTENGAVAAKTTLNPIYDLFALGGAYRKRSVEDCILLFKKAVEVDALLALKCLFYLRDVRGGQGERRFFRICYSWFCKEYPQMAIANLKLIPFYGRWDDLYCTLDTEVESAMFDLINDQLKLDYESLKHENVGVSLLGKWLKSENTSSKQSRAIAKRIRTALKLTSKQYRKMLSALRTRINIVEKLMSENRWDEINFEKIPSKAGLIYRNAFAHNDIIGDKYAEFINNRDTKVNAGTLYPYEIVNKVTQHFDHFWSAGLDIEETERATLNKYWENQKDYLNGKPCRTMCVVDTSGSMTCGNPKPIDVAISLGMYCAERIGEPFKNYFISFSSRPQLIEVEGIDFCDKVERIYRQNLCQNTDLGAVFNLLLHLAVDQSLNQDEIPEQIIVISDMEIDSGSCWDDDEERTYEMQKIREKWTAAGYKMPKLVYWNVDARHNTILEDATDSDVTFVSGCSPIIFKSVLTGKSGIELMLEVLNSARYSLVKVD